MEREKSLSKILSIVIPAYNEEAYIGELIKLIGEVDVSALGLKLEIIVVNDYSSDSTAEIVASIPSVRLLNHTINSGKGRAVRTGLEAVQGDYVLIQDADLEYDPQDYLVLLPPVLNGDIDVVYGSRYLKGLDRGILNNFIHAKHPEQTWAAYIGGRSISLFAWAFTGRLLNDTVTAYKLFPAQLICNMELVTTGFELDHEISCKVLAGGHRIKEVPIRYYPRTVADGKKIGLKDWFKAIKTFYRFRNG